MPEIPNITACPQCFDLIPDDTNWCPRCGRPLGEKSDIPYLDPEEDADLCPKCLTPAPLNTNFCPNCGLPLTQIATTDPIKEIWAAGYIYREGPRVKNSLVVYIGMWIFFAPFVIIGIWGINTMDLNTFLFSLPFSIAAAAILYRATKSFYAVRAPTTPDADDS